MAKGGMAKKVLHAVTKPNNDAFGGFFVPRQTNLLGTGLVFGGVVAVTGGNEALKARNANKLGPVIADSQARMMDNYGIVGKTIRKASGGHPEVFADMAEEAVRSHNPFGVILDDYGANAKMISALYHMGGR